MTREEAFAAINKELLGTQALIPISTVVEALLAERDHVRRVIAELGSLAVAAAPGNPSKWANIMDALIEAERRASLDTAKPVSK